VVQIWFQPDTSDAHVTFTLDMLLAATIIHLFPHRNESKFTSNATSFRNPRVCFLLGYNEQHTSAYMGKLRKSLLGRDSNLTASECKSRKICIWF